MSKKLILHNSIPFLFWCVDLDLLYSNRRESTVLFRMLRFICKHHIDDIKLYKYIQFRDEHKYGCSTRCHPSIEPCLRCCSSCRYRLWVQMAGILHATQ